MVIERGMKIGERNYVYRCKCDSCSEMFPVISTVANMKKMQDITEKTLCKSCANDLLAAQLNSDYYITENEILGFCPSCKTPAMKRLDRLDRKCKKCTRKSKPHEFTCSYCGSNFTSDITDKAYETIKDYKYACASCTEEILQRDSFEDVAFSEIPPTSRNPTLLASCTRCNKPMWKRIKRLVTRCVDCKRR